jgi:phosphatidate cytidylyltransferase
MRLPFSTNFIKRLSSSIALGVGFWAIYLYFSPIYFSCILGLILTLIIIFEWTHFFPISKPTFWLLMPLYLIIPFSLLIMLNNDPIHRELLFILFVLVFSFDTGSYIMGNLIGTHPIWLAISPKKTWEGAVGGFLFAFIGFICIIIERGYKTPWWFIAFFTLVICIFSLLGDLFESWLKRRAHLKDSGHLLPGHGGFLDRFDGIIFAVFFFYFLRNQLFALLIK